MTTPCYGIQQTGSSPEHSMRELASFYLTQCVEETGGLGHPFCLAGYSLGGAIVVEMALQAQARGLDVTALVMLDGSPAYVKRPIDTIRNSAPANKVRVGI